MTTSSTYATLVIGHTHDTAIIARPESDKKLILLGSLPEDGVYLDLDALEIRRI